MNPLYPRFNEMVLLAVEALMPDGFDTTDDESRCDSVDKVMRHYGDTGRILVWTGASDQSIFGAPHVNHAFRAWHDYVHVMYRLPFTAQGEHTVMQIQQRHVDTLGGFVFTNKEKELFYRILECEVDGQVEHLKRTGEFPSNQREFTQQYMEARYA